MRWTRTGGASDLEDRRGGSRGVQVGRLELPADCYAGVWARSVFDRLEDGDIEEAMTASQAVGDDRLQKQAGQRVNPDSFTHGSSAQRLEWFKRGSANGEPADCDTFSGDV